MKRGILVAILIIVIFVIFLALLGGFIYLQFQQEPHVPENSFLKINFMGNIVDNNDSITSSDLSIRDLFYHIKRARMDKRIKGIIIKISGIHSGFSKIEDIGLILSDFRKSGKEVFAYIEAGGLIEYYLATFAKKIYVFKGWDLFMHGLVSEAIFLKNTLSKLGIQAEMYHIGDYKTAANMFTEDKMTPNHKESIQTLMNDIYDSVLEGISRRRNVKLEDLKEILQEAPISNDEYQKKGLIDKAIFEDEIFKDMKTDFKTIDFNTYKETSSPKPFTGQKKIAVIFASGEINLGKSQSSDKSIFKTKILGSETLAGQLESVRKNPSFIAAVLRIDSPGGSALASEIIRRQVELFKEKKPLIVSMSDLAASGGYWISVPCSKILALPQTITGSIGVVGGKFVLKGLYDSIGMNKEILKTSKYADMFSDYKLFSPEEKQKLMMLMNKIYLDFLKIVSSGRNIKLSEVEKIARGRVWSGKTAAKLKLIDQFGGILDAIEEAKKMSKIPPSEKIGIRILPKQKSLLDYVFELLGFQVKDFNPITSIETKIKKYNHFFPALLMPYTLHIF